MTHSEDQTDTFVFRWVFTNRIVVLRSRRLHIPQRFGGRRGGAALLALECSFLHVRSEGHEVRVVPERSRFPDPAASHAFEVVVPHATNRGISATDRGD